MIRKVPSIASRCGDGEPASFDFPRWARLTHASNPPSVRRLTMASSQAQQDEGPECIEFKRHSPVLNSENSSRRLLRVKWLFLDSLTNSPMSPLSATL